MIVLGADTHKRSHTIAAVGASDRRAAGRADDRGSVTAGSPRCCAGRAAWATSGSGRWRTAGTCPARFERFLIAHGERVVRVATQADGRRAPRRPRARQVRPHRRARRRARRAARGRRAVAGRAAGRRRARHPAAGRSPRTARPHPRRAQQRPALAPARPLARAGVPRRRVVLEEVVARGSRGAWRAPSRPRASGSRATSCAVCASSRRPSTRSRPRSPTSSPRSRRSCSPSPASAR